MRMGKNSYARWGWGLAAMLTVAALPGSRASAFCVGGGRLTFESSEAVAAWRFTGNGGVDYGQRNFLPTHQARTRNEPEYVNNGWLFGNSRWFAMERVLHSNKPIEFLTLTAYLQSSTNLHSIEVALLDARTGEVVEAKPVSMSAGGSYSDFTVFFGRQGVLVPQELVVRFGFWAPGEDTWLRVGSVDIRHNTSLADCDGSGPLAEMW